MLYVDQQLNYVLQNRSEYRFSHIPAPNVQPAIPGQTSLHNFLHLPGLGYSVNAIGRIDFKSLTFGDAHQTTVNYRFGDGDYPVVAVVKSSEPELNGRKFSFEYEQQR